MFVGHSGDTAMESETRQETFGSYLAGFRIKRHLSVEAVAATTKITIRCIRAIEENAHDHLPPPAYVRSFIRLYADAVGANADIAINLYRSDLQQQENTKQRQRKRRAKLSIVRRALLALVVIVSILLLLRYTDILPDEAPSPPAAPGPTELAATSATDAASAVAPGTAAAPPGEPLRLKILAVETTWLKIIVDGQKARSYRLKPEERLELEGSINFNMMIGSATGVKIFLNDRPVKIYGSKDQVVSLKIP